MLPAPARPAPVEPEQLLSVAGAPGGGGRAVVDVAGEVDAYTAPLLEACLRSQATQPRLRVLLVDLSRVTVLGGAGLSVLWRAQRTCRGRGARLVVRATPYSQVARVVRRSGLGVEPTGSAARDDRVAGTALLSPAQPRPQRRRRVGPVRAGRRRGVPADPALATGRVSALGAGGGQVVLDGRDGAEAPASDDVVTGFPLAGELLGGRHLDGLAARGTVLHGRSGIGS